MYIGFANVLYIFHFKCIYKKKNKNGCDPFNRFHSPVIVHRKHEGVVTRHEFLHPLQENISSFWGPSEPLLTGSFFLATPLVSMYVDPVSQITTIRLQITTCVLLGHKKIITLLHCGMIITGTVKNEFTVSQCCIIKDYG